MAAVPASNPFSTTTMSLSQHSVAPAPASSNSQSTKPTTFPGFPELPTELQMQIWSYAAIPNKRVLLHKMFFQRPVKSWLQDLRQPMKFMELYYCLYKYLRDDAANGRYRGFREPYVFCVVPDTLLRTCRLARIVRMERWKKKVEGLPVLKKVEGTGVLVPKLNAEITEGLHREIKALKSGV